MAAAAAIALSRARSLSPPPSLPPSVSVSLSGFGASDLGSKGQVRKFRKGRGWEASGAPHLHTKSLYACSLLKRGTTRKLLVRDVLYCFIITYLISCTHSCTYTARWEKAQRGNGFLETYTEAARESQKVNRSSGLSPKSLIPFKSSLSLPSIRTISFLSFFSIWRSWRVVVVVFGKTKKEKEARPDRERQGRGGG
jgi:hypothetical protein